MATASKTVTLRYRIDNVRPGLRNQPGNPKLSKGFWPAQAVMLSAVAGRSGIPDARWDCQRYSFIVGFPEGGPGVSSAGAVALRRSRWRVKAASHAPG